MLDETYLVVYNQETVYREFDTSREETGVRLTLLLTPFDFANLNEWHTGSTITLTS